MGGDLDILRILWESGLVVKAVLAMLLLGSFLSWSVALEKRKQFKKLEQSNLKFMRFYEENHNLREIFKICDDLPASPFATMFRNGYEELTKISEKIANESKDVSLRDHFEKFGMAVIERGLKKGVNEANLYMDSKQTILASVGSVTPYIGLFGTVWGIINSFTGLADGGASLEKIAPGIAEALVATAIGLFAAIPAVLFFNHFSQKASEWNSRMDSFGQEFMNLVERSLFSKK